MGLISKLEDKLSGNKSHSTTEDQKLREQEANSTRTHGTTNTPQGGLTGEGSHLGHNTSGSGLTGTSHGTHGTTTGSHNPLSSSKDTYGSTGHGTSTGLTGGSHGTHGTTTGSHNPLSSSNDTYGSTGTHGTTTGSHNPLSSSTNTHGSSGITGRTHPLVSGDNSRVSGTGIGSNTHHTGTGLGHNTHGSGITGSSTTGNDALGSSHRREAGDIGSRGYTSGTHNTGTHGTHGSSLTGQDSQDFVPGSHPAANNPEAIPTAGGHKVGGVGEGIGHSSHHTGVHQTTGDKVKNALPGQHGNAHDAYGNPINADRSTGSGLTGGTHSGVGGPTHGSSGLTGTHANTGLSGTHGSSGLTGTHGNTGFTGTYGNTGSNFNSSAQPLGQDPSFTDRHSGPGVGNGLAAGAAGGAGLAGASHHHNDPTHHSGSGLTGNTHGSGLTGNNHGSGLTGNTHGSGLTGNTHSTGLGSNVPGSGYSGAHQDEYSRGQQAAYQQHQGGLGNTSSVPGAYPEADNRTMMEKAKDKLSNKRTDYPDDPTTGTNYTQQTGGAHGVTGTHAGQPGFTGSNNNLYGSHPSSGGVGGITQGVDNTHLGSQYPPQQHQQHPTSYGQGVGPQQQQYEQQPQYQQQYQQPQQQHHSSLGGVGAGLTGGNGPSQQHHTLGGSGASNQHHSVEGRGAAYEAGFKDAVAALSRQGQ
ncbi:unnamed protein product [Cercospora beticola]|nr:unnamed protein product [Cercospora beticola]